MNPVEARLAALEARLAAVESRLANGGSSAPTTGAGGGTATAPDSDLDGQYGDPVVKKNPSRWVEQGGDSFAGCKMSECPSAFLLMVASLYDWQAGKDEEQQKTYTDRRSGQQRPTAPLRRQDAARARGWAKRNVGQTSGPSVASTSGDNNHGAAGTDDEIPF